MPVVKAIIATNGYVTKFECIYIVCWRAKKFYNKMWVQNDNKVPKPFPEIRQDWGVKGV
jgi:hypothetical protein